MSVTEISIHRVEKMVEETDKIDGEGHSFYVKTIEVTNDHGESVNIKLFSDDKKMLKIKKIAKKKK